MFLRAIGSSDARFKQLRFHDGMNILLAEKAVKSTSGDSRNGAGKTSFVRILRYILGGRLDKSLKAEQLANQSFWAELELEGFVEPIRVQRPVSPQTKVYVDSDLGSVERWKIELAKLFGISESISRPTVAQLFRQLIRDCFDNPLKTYSAEPDWESGIRLGFFLGFSPEILAKVQGVTELEKNKKVLSKAISDGALGGVVLRESELRERLAQLQEKRSRLEDNLAAFRVDEQYADHQIEADRLSCAIRNLNDEAVSLERRKRDLQLAMKEECSAEAGEELAKQVKSIYAEVGIILPDIAIRRFSEVAEFHVSVVRNRKMYLQKELLATTQRLTAIEVERQDLDERRANVMGLLNESMALETFRSVEREFADLDSHIADLERKKELVQSVNNTGRDLHLMKSEAEASVRTEIADRQVFLESAIDLFRRLGKEIYADRDVSLLIEATSKGVLKVVPKIDGDASAGIQGVKTFLLDMVCAVTAIQLGRAPRILVHDSQLFDSMDDRQISSCLNIGARLAEQERFQYIVTLNSDRLSAAEDEGFNRRNYVIDPILTDVGERGGLFGFRFI